MNNESDAAPVSAGQFIVDKVRACSPDELRLLSHIGRRHAADLDAMGASNLCELWLMLALSADAILADHPDAFTPSDLAFLDALDDTRPEGPNVV